MGIHPRRACVLGGKNPNKRVPHVWGSMKRVQRHQSTRLLLAAAADHRCRLRWTVCMAHRIEPALECKREKGGDEASVVGAGGKVPPLPFSALTLTGSS